MFSTERGRFYALITEISSCVHALDGLRQKVFGALALDQPLSDSVLESAWSKLCLGFDSDENHCILEWVNRQIGRQEPSRDGRLLDQAFTHFRDVFLAMPRLRDELRDTLCLLRNTQAWWRVRYQAEAMGHDELGKVCAARVSLHDELSSRKAAVGRARQALHPRMTGFSEVEVACLLAALGEDWTYKAYQQRNAGMVPTLGIPSNVLKQDLEQVIRVHEIHPYFDFVADAGKHLLGKLEDPRVLAALSNLRDRVTRQTETVANMAQLTSTEISHRSTLLQARQIRSREECELFEKRVRDLLGTLIQTDCLSDRTREQGAAVAALTEHLIHAAQSTHDLVQIVGLLSRSALEDVLEGLAKSGHAGLSDTCWRAVSTKLLDAGNELTLVKLRVSVCIYGLSHRDALRTSQQQAALAGATPVNPGRLPVDALTGAGTEAVRDLLRKAARMPLRPWVESASFLGHEQSTYRMFRRLAEGSPAPFALVAQWRHTISKGIQRFTDERKILDLNTEVAAGTALTRLLLDEVGSTASLDEALSAVPWNFSEERLTDAAALRVFGTGPTRESHLAQLRTELKNTLSWYLTAVPAAASERESG